MAFVNRHGATDFFTTRGKWTNAHNIKRSEYTRTLGNWSTATGINKVDSGSNETEFGFNVSDRGRANLVTDREEVWTVSTGPLNAYETSLFMAMVNSADVFAAYVRSFGPSGEVLGDLPLVPVVIRTNTIREIRKLNAQVSEYTFELIYSRADAYGNFGPITTLLTP